MSGGFGSANDFLERLRAEEEARKAAVEAALVASETQRTLVHNEQTKLVASLLNIIAAGFVITGIIAPLTTVGTANAPTAHITGQGLAVMGIWMILAIILHYGASLVLRNLR